jgi:glycogen debranching enzyme
MRLGQDVLGDLERALAEEWLLTNGVGGSALGTATAGAARREHGWLIAAGPWGETRTALLRLDERLTVGETAFDLGVIPLADGEVRGLGHRLIEDFRLDPWPTWRLRAGDVVLERQLHLVHGHHALVASYRHLEGPTARLSLNPIVVARAPGELQREDSRLRGVIRGQPGRLRIETVPGHPALILWHNGVFSPARVWQHGLAHPLDPPRRDAAERGVKRVVRGRPAWHVATPAGAEDAMQAGSLEIPLEPGGVALVVAATEEDLFRALAMEGRLGTPPPTTLAGCVAALADAERRQAAAWRRIACAGADHTARDAAAAHAAPDIGTTSPVSFENDPWLPRLADAVAAGLTRRGHRLTMTATLPDGTERGEDTLRAMSALIALRAFEPVAAVLRGTIEYLDAGLAPESFHPSTGAPRYGDPAPALWLVHAADLYARRAEDPDFARATLYPALESVMHYFRAGTRGGVRVDSDGLLASGEGDAAEKRADLNALWYHALVALAQLARMVGRRENGAFFLAWARDHQKRFLDAFWDGSRGMLAWSVTAAGPVHELRPGLVLAASLPPSLLPPDAAATLVRTIEQRLFTPWGLRERPDSERVSPAWLGPYLVAWLRVHGRDARAQTRVREWLALLEARTALDGHVPEGFRVARGRSSPRSPEIDGAPASPLAAAELLHLLVEELDPVAVPASV